jgi:hypothetical protein
MYGNKALGFLSCVVALSLLAPLTADARHSLRGANGRFISANGKPQRVRHDRQAAKLARKLYRAHKRDRSITSMTEGGVTAELYNLTHAGMPFAAPPKPTQQHRPYISIHIEGGGGFKRSFEVKGVRLGAKAKGGHPFRLIGGRVALDATYRTNSNATYTEVGPAGIRRSAPDMDRRHWENNVSSVKVPTKLSAQPRDRATGQFKGRTSISRSQWEQMGKNLE